MAAPVERHLVEVERGGRAAGHEVAEELLLVLAVDGQERHLDAHGLRDVLLVAREVHVRQLHVLDRLHGGAELLRVQGDGAELLRRPRVVALVAPVRVRERAMVLLHEQLHLVDQPRLRVPDLGEAETPPLRDVLDVAVAPPREQRVAHLDAEDGGMAATTKGATGAAGGAGADAVLLEAAATALPAAVAGVLVRGVKKVAAACFFCTAAAVLATSDFFAFFAFDLAPSFAPRVRPIAQSKRRAKDLAKDSTRVEQEPLDPAY